LKSFGSSTRKARKAYVDFVSKGVRMGHRPELIGGGLLRSAGGRSTLKAMRNGGVRNIEYSPDDKVKQFNRFRVKGNGLKAKTNS